MDREILHVDMNAYYASVEELHHPELAGRPLAVGGDPEARHGIVLTANYPAKRLGVKTGMALWQAKKVCPAVVFLPPRMDLYLRFSHLAREIYADYTDLIEPFGIDESWLDVTASASCMGQASEIARAISTRIKHELGLTVSIGVSWNKIFAKFGSDYKKPDAITIITRENYKQIIWTSPVEDLLYVGRSHSRLLRSLGILTIGDLALTDPSLLVSQFGKMGLILHSFACGRDETPVSPLSHSSPVKSIGNSTTTPKDLTDNDEVRLVLLLLAESVASRLRDNHFVGDNIGIYIRDSELSGLTRQKKIAVPTNISEEITDHAFSLFLNNYEWTRPIRSVGVRVSGLLPDTYCYQTDLFTDETKREKQLKMDIAVDGLRNRFGHDCILRGRMYFDRYLSELDAKAEDHMVHPHSYFAFGNRTGIRPDDRHQHFTET